MAKESGGVRAAVISIIDGRHEFEAQETAETDRGVLYALCDDGGIGEGISDAVAKLLANHWDHFSDFVKLASNNKEFQKFVVRHVDGTIDWTHDAPKINENARLHCPSSSARLCRALITQTTPEKR